MAPVQARCVPFTIYWQVFDTDGTTPVDGVNVTVTNLETGSSEEPTVTASGGYYADNLGHLKPNCSHREGDRIQIFADDGKTGKTNTTVVPRAATSPQLVDLILQAPSPFDTGSGTYPRIMGTHNGTIKPYHTVNVSRMYTYPCPGTGGHAEYVRIWNESETLAEGNRKGYKGDWHNITFSKHFILLADRTYNYTIRTGSYPQIHHNRFFILTVPDGEITCTEFIDTNGKKYNDWIPAIRLYDLQN